MLKHLHPRCEVHISDLAPAAVAAANRWELAFETRLDGRWAFLAHRSPFADAQFDRIFMFQAFHHVGIGNRTGAVLDELARILRPDGVISLLSEPSAPEWLYERQHRHINAVRKASGADVDEDVIVVERLRRAARERGLRLEHSIDASWHYREMSLLGILRNAMVARAPILERILPCGVNIRLLRV
jgi:SAM-dependent methyltransferase